MGNYKAFADFEFSDRPTCIISAGIVIADDGGNIMETYSSLCKRQDCKVDVGTIIEELTGITTEQLNSAPSTETVFDELSKLFDKYGIEEVYVWGSQDRIVIKKDIKAINYSSEKRLHQIRWVDLERKYTRNLTQFGLEHTKSCIGLQRMKCIYGALNEVKHDALSDAQDLLLLHNIIELRQESPNPIYIEYLNNLHMVNKGTFVNTDFMSQLASCFSFPEENNTSEYFKRRQNEIKKEILSQGELYYEIFFKKKFEEKDIAL